MNVKTYPVRVYCKFEENSTGTKIIKRPLTPRQAVRLRCLDCSGWIPSEVKIAIMRIVFYIRIEWVKVGYQ